jgi:hypothetical protein
MASEPWRSASAQHHALQRLLVLAQDEVAQALAYLALDRRQLAPHVVHVGAAHGQLGLELRVVGAETELHAAVRHSSSTPVSSESTCDCPARRSESA